MLLSYLKIFFNIEAKDIQIFEDESAFDGSSEEENVLSITEEALNNATVLKDIFQLFKKGSAK